MSRKNKPLNNGEEALKEYDALIEELSRKYPDVNIKELSLDEALKKANENKKSEMMEFKAKVESTFMYYLRFSKNNCSIFIQELLQ